MPVDFRQVLYMLELDVVEERNFVRMGRYLLDLNLMRVAGVVAGAYICYATLFFFMQRQFIYPGRTIKVPVRPPVSPAGGELLRIESAAGRVEPGFCRPLAEVTDDGSRWSSSFTAMAR